MSRAGKRTSVRLTLGERAVLDRIAAGKAAFGGCKDRRQHDLVYEAMIVLLRHRLVELTSEGKYVLTEAGTALRTAP